MFFICVFFICLLSSCGLIPQVDSSLTFAIAPAVGAALISTGAQLVSGAGQAMANAKSYTKWRQSFDHQHRANIEDWNMANQYNLPVNQVNRLLQAGINPNMGQVDATGGVISPSSGTNIPQQNPLEGFQNLPNQLGSLSDVQQTEANTNNIIANTAKTNSETIAQDIQNTIQTETGIPMARKNLEKLGYETMEFKERAEYQRILTSKAGQQIELALRESRGRGEQLHLDNLIKTKAFDDLVKSYGYENAFKYAMTQLTDQQAKYVGYDAQSRRMGAIASQRQADASVMQAQTAQAMLPYLQAYQSAQTDKERFDAGLSAIDLLVKDYAYQNGISEWEVNERARHLRQDLNDKVQNHNIKSADEFWETAKGNAMRYFGDGVADYFNSPEIKQVITAGGTSQTSPTSEPWQDYSHQKVSNGVRNVGSGVRNVSRSHKPRKRKWYHLR